MSPAHCQPKAHLRQYGMNVSSSVNTQGSQAAFKLPGHFPAMAILHTKPKGGEDVQGRLAQGSLHAANSHSNDVGVLGLSWQHVLGLSVMASSSLHSSTECSCSLGCVSTLITQTENSDANVKERGAQ